MRLILAIILLSPFFAFAQHQELIIKKDTKVYKKNSVKSGELTTLESGSRVPISTKDYGGWVKIKTQVAGDLYYGWIPKKNIRGFRVRKVDREALLGERVAYHRKQAFGIFTNFSYARMGEEEFTSANQSVALQEGSGTNVFFGFHYDYPLSITQQLNFFFSLREMEYSGKARFNDGATDIDVDLSQETMSFGASLKNYDSASDDFWWSYGLEIARTTGATLTSFNTTKVEEDELGFFILPHLGFGYDYSISEHLYLIPEGKLNLAINTSSLVTLIDLKLSFSYAF